MLKKAGIVVVGAAAGVLSMTSVAFAGDASCDNGGDSHHGHHHDGGWGHDRDGDHGPGPCDDSKFAGSAGDNTVNAPNAASNLDLTHVNILSTDHSHDPCDGGHGPGGPGGPGDPKSGGDNPGGGSTSTSGGKTSANFGNSLVNAPNLASNPDVDHVNVLSDDYS